MNAAAHLKLPPAFFPERGLPVRDFEDMRDAVPIFDANQPKPIRHRPAGNDACVAQDALACFRVFPRIANS